MPVLDLGAQLHLTVVLAELAGIVEEVAQHLGQASGVVMLKHGSPRMRFEGGLAGGRRTPVVREVV